MTACPACAVKDAEIAELRSDVEDAEHTVKWAPAEHELAYKAIQQSEGMPTNHYPSFQERVWWRAAKDVIKGAEARVVTLRTLYETLARKEHARLAWDHREGAALGLPHVSGDMEACQHPDCQAACAALKGEPA